MKKKFNLLVGGYTEHSKDKGIYVFSFDPATLEVTLKNSLENVASPSYLSIDLGERTLYCANEDGEKSTVSAFRYTAESGALQLLNRAATGADPCYVAHSERHVVAANYGAGSIAVFERRQDGLLSDAVQVVRHQGGSVAKPRQESPHVHMVQFSPCQNLLFANDLGNDTICIYDYNPSAGSPLLLRHTVAVTPGFGPRHLAFHPAGNHFYVIHELSATVETYGFSDGQPVLLQQVPLDGRNDKKYKSGADIRLSADGKFAYATNRGRANTVTVFGIMEGGTLSPLQQLSVQGESPRNLAIDPTGSCLLIANENSDSITFFRRDSSNGRLCYAEKLVDLKKPAFLAFTFACPAAVF